MAGNHKNTSREGSARQQMSLAIHFHPTGHHVAAWLHPRSQIDAGSNAAHYLKMAQTAERGKFDLIFLPIRSPSAKAIFVPKAGGHNMWHISSR